MTTKRLFKSKIHELDFLLASIIFLVSILELVSWRMQEGQPATITNPGNNYLIYWYPRISTATIWLFSLFFFINSFRFNACIYTKIVSVTYFLIQSISLAAFVFGFGMGIYETIAYPCLLYGIVCLTMIKVIRWCLR